MSIDYRFEGWCGLDKEAVGNMKWQEYEPKPFTDHDVDIRITHCGMCGADLHTLRNGWGFTPYPCVVGHEIVGRAVRVGKNVDHVKVGDRVGVGAQADSCLKPDCEACADGQESYCPNTISTFGSNWPDGSKSYGGYANYSRTAGRFIFRIPVELPSHEVGPMLCAGITVYAPLKREGCGPGKKVGIIGLGGLGHFGVLFAKALGADKVVVISRSNAKKEDAKKLGADDFLATSEEKGWDSGASRLSNSLDLIISTTSSPNMPLSGYLSLLKFRGQFIQVGAPEDNLPGFNAFALLPKRAKIGGSIIGSRAEIREMLDFAVKKNIHPWIELRPLQEANQAMMDLDAGKPRYRYCLVNENHEEF
ncbi:zinc-binding alcohol dehydrogenase [Rhizodiscina lignyota]|uniref:alcohol dehydrogenase (NADP(+)) n=1 Tax=Rhizodiscina lignyota TaxID=1504668 RepID=A0A9P4IMD4_9PEZI|nr:zinc-binding alcohol dehydrogenase [Rhizodiscina lignyota]